VHYAFDTVALAKGTGGAVVDTGGKSWFFVTADYAFGHALEADTSKIIEARGGKVLGSVKTPLNASDFSSFMLQAQNSKAQILGLANAGGDTINSIKAAKGVRRHQEHEAGRPAGLLHATSTAGPEEHRRHAFTAAWYWDMNDGSRKLATPSCQDPAPPQRDPAATSRHHEYLKAVEKAGTLDADKVMATLKSTKIDDFFGQGYIREDGRYVHGYVPDARQVAGHPRAPGTITRSSRSCLPSRSGPPRRKANASTGGDEPARHTPAAAQRTASRGSCPFFMAAVPAAPSVNPQQTYIRYLRLIEMDLGQSPFLSPTRRSRSLKKSAACGLRFHHGELASA
jgi:hypothetical protein